MSLPKMLAVVGPTASGKTALGIELARQLGGEVISADSRQVYRGMDIGTGKPMGEWKRREGSLSFDGMVTNGASDRYLEVEGVPHVGFDLVDPSEETSAAVFQAYAYQEINAMLSRGVVPILVGGTGLWVRSVVRALSFVRVPPQPALREAWAHRTAADLFFEYKQLDPVGAELIDRHNPRRIARALEICHVTGKPASSLQAPSDPRYETLMIGLSPDREVLKERIRTRIDEMVARGLVNEVRGLVERFGKDAPGLETIGYQELVPFFEGRTTLAVAIDEITRHTNDYAKRQRTWFQKEEVRWVTSAEEALRLAEAFL